MKKIKEYFNIAIISIFINLSLFQFLSAQNYQQVLKTDSTTWTIAHQEIFGIVIDVFHTKTFQDSTYSYVFTNNIFYPYIGKLRENIDEGKVWFTSAVSNQEYLIMDMNLQTGDTFEFNTGVYGQVDSVYYLDKRKVIRFDLFSSRWDESIKFIEGVGPSNAFSVLSDFDWFYVTCKYDQDVLNYVNNNSYFIGCMPNPTGVELRADGSNQFTIFPNPAGSQTWLQLPENLPFSQMQIVLYGCTGRLLHRAQPASQFHRIELAHLPKGLYLIKVWDGKRWLAKKLVKE